MSEGMLKLEINVDLEAGGLRFTIAAGSVLFTPGQLTEMCAAFRGGSVARRFLLVRVEDVSGVSGTGVVAEGCAFSTGKVAMTWVTEYRSTTVYDDISELVAIHGHGGRTVVQWVD